jgi:hypothetical protein
VSLLLYAVRDSDLTLHWISNMCRVRIVVCLRMPPEKRLTARQTASLDRELEFETDSGSSLSRSSREQSEALSRSSRKFVRSDFGSSHAHAYGLALARVPVDSASIVTQSTLEHRAYYNW